MNNSTIKSITGAILFLFFAALSSAQEKVGGIAEFDKTVHDFGDIMLSDGEQNCKFKVKNISAKPMLIHLSLIHI